MKKTRQNNNLSVANPEFAATTYANFGFNAGINSSVIKRGSGSEKLTWQTCFNTTNEILSICADDETTTLHRADK